MFVGSIKYVHYGKQLVEVVCSFISIKVQENKGTFLSDFEHDIGVKLRFFYRKFSRALTVILLHG